MQIIGTAVICLSLLCTIAGCGGGTDKAVVESRRSAQQAYEDGLAAMQSKDYPTAEKRFTESLEVGRLYADLLDSARANQVVALAAQDKFGEAETAFTKLKESALEKDLVFAAQSFLLQKQGKTKQAKAAWAKARRINRFVKKFGG